MNWVQITIYVSLVAQVLSTLYSLLGLYVPLFNENAILTEILALETFVQIIELSFYVTFGFLVPLASSTMDIAIFRYADWFLTTPAMLISTISFMDYIRRKELPSQDDSVKELPSLWDFLVNNVQTVIWIVLSNTFMLLMGFLYEAGMIDIFTSTILGFAGFVGLFWKIYEKYAKGHIISRYLWYYMVSSWSLYGVAAVFPNIIKNTSFNLLDIVSKNFYSVFLTAYIMNLPSS